MPPDHQRHSVFPGTRQPAASNIQDHGNARRLRGGNVDQLSLCCHAPQLGASVWILLNKIQGTAPTKHKREWTIVKLYMCCTLKYTEHTCTCTCTTQTHIHTYIQHTTYTHILHTYYIHIAVHTYMYTHSTLNTYTTHKHNVYMYVLFSTCMYTANMFNVCTRTVVHVQYTDVWVVHFYLSPKNYSCSLWDIQN